MTIQYLKLENINYKILVLIIKEFVSSRIKGLCLAFLAMIGSGIFAIPYGLSLETTKPLTVVWGIFFWALLFSLPGAWISRKKMNYSLKIGFITLVTALAGLLANYSVCQALVLDSPTLFNLLSRSEIIMAVILSWIFLKEWISTRVWITLIFIIVGIIIMKLESLNLEFAEFHATMWALLTAFGFAVMLVLAKSIIHEIDPQTFNVFRLILALTFLSFFEEVRDGITNLKFNEWKLLAIAAFCGPFLGRLSYTYSLKYLSVSKSVIICSFSPAITLMLELLVFGSIISWLEALGGLIMLGSIIWVFLPHTKKI